MLCILSGERRAEGYTATKLRELSAYADLATKPARPALAQNLGFASLIAFLVTISAEVIKSTPLFSLGKGAVVLVLVLAGTFIYWLVLDGMHSAAYEKAWIKRYLDMAACDLDEVPILLNPTELV